MKSKFENLQEKISAAHRVEEMDLKVNEIEDDASSLIYTQK